MKVYKKGGKAKKKGGGMAGLIRAADNFLKALAG